MGRRAFTLVEMLVAMMLTLIMVAAIAEFYAYVGEMVRDGRAGIEMNGQVRAAVQRLKSDFNQVTSSVVPWADDGAAGGYFEYREGPAADYDANGNAVPDVTGDEDADTNGQNDLDQLGITDLLGDGDDYLAFTIRSRDAPFSGRLGATIVRSQFAEVIWFTAFTDLDGDKVWQFNEPRYIVRRLLLILPGSTLPMQPGDVNPFQSNDISAHQQADGTWIANTLADLTRRENRFAHLGTPANFPNRLLIDPQSSATFETFIMGGDYQGEDVVITNVLAFDVRAYDPESVLLADVDQTSATPAINALGPSDPGYAQAVSNTHAAIGTGEYVDLGYGVSLQNRLTRQPFSLQPNVAQQRIAAAIGRSYYATQAAAPPGFTTAQVNTYRPLIGRTYDTWSLNYERDGVNQDGDNFTDESTNGIDDDNQNGVDDYGERETVPPYPQPLRGLQVKIRVYEPGTRQMRQATVTTDFLAE
jgi:prepilin-type N-terminal cleavage/methylation domain-containing protein